MRLLLLAQLLVFSQPAGAEGPYWEQELRTIRSKALDAKRYYIPEFDPHGAFIRGPETVPAVALTFDDGPGEDTPAVLEVLARHGARATFFMVGAQVEKFPYIARKVVEAGHEIGNHTYFHVNFCKKPLPDVPERMAMLTNEVERTARILKETTGVGPVLVRMPYACRSAWVESAIAGMGYTVVRWSVDGEDWRQGGAESIAAYYLKRAQPGAVFLLHDAGGGGRGATVLALERILTGLGKKGLTAIPAGEMLRHARPDSAATAR